VNPPKANRSETGRREEKRAIFPGEAIVAEVLIVLPEKQRGLYLQTLLQSRGHQVTLAFDAETALREAAIAMPRVILVDMGLQDLPGYSLIRILRKTPPHLQSWIAAVGEHVPDPEQYDEAGINACVNHDCTPEELIEALVATPGSPLA
jgi:CheY-like chemotaxis protein